MTDAPFEALAATPPLDTCWNRIGTRGDGSCPELAAYTRCLNCPVFERAATRLLDRPLDDADLAQAAQAAHGTLRPALESVSAPHTGQTQEAAGAVRSALVFRVAREWLALPCEAVSHVDTLRPIHSLPHRRDRIVLGLVNIQGALTIAAALGAILRLEHDDGAQPEPGAGTRYARLLVAQHQGDTVAFPVDEIDGIARFAPRDLAPVPHTLSHADAVHAHGVLTWHDHSIGLLDVGRVFASLARSLQ
jgi:chemotaxis-related protein WspD